MNVAESTDIAQRMKSDFIGRCYALRKAFAVDTP